MGPVLKVEKLLLDTNILIDFLRGYQKTTDFLSRPGYSFLLSTITVAELYSGLKGKAEEKMLEALLKRFQIIPVTASIAQKGGLFKNKYFKSHGVGIADSVIAATAELEGTRLVTLNIKHFPMIKSKFAPY